MSAKMWNCDFCDKMGKLWLLLQNDICYICDKYQNCEVSDNNEKWDNCNKVKSVKSMILT